MNLQRNKKFREYAIIGTITWIFYLMIWYFSYVASNPSLSNELKTVFFVNTSLGGLVAAMLAVFFYDLMSSKRTEDRFQIVIPQFKKNHEQNTKLPEKATSNSVGYDFFAPEAYLLKPKEKHTFWTDIKVRLKQDEALLISPRSSIGIKKSLMLANTIGTIDPDYYGNESNDGNIGICLYNYGDEPVPVEKGDRIAQGTVINVVHDKTTGDLNKRTGGIGSTGK